MALQTHPTGTDFLDDPVISDYGVRCGCAYVRVMSSESWPGKVDSMIKIEIRGPRFSAVTKG